MAGGNSASRPRGSVSESHRFHPSLQALGPHPDPSVFSACTHKSTPVINTQTKSHQVVSGGEMVEPKLGGIRKGRERSEKVDGGEKKTG